jgi:flagellar biosynthesis/type III secretory pathway M-ring protein FliF/YscJ
MLLLLSKRRHPFISKKRLWTCVRARYERNGNMWESVLWLAVIGLIQIVTFFVMVMFVRMAIREHKRELAQMTPSDVIPASHAPQEPQLAGSHSA